VLLQVVHIAVEMAPIAKVGGMGDVVTALARAVQEEGNDVEVIIPKYDCIHYNQVGPGGRGGGGVGTSSIRVRGGRVGGDIEVAQGRDADLCS
jgi:starch synthase